MSGTVLVTGAGGFVGSAVLRLLARMIRREEARFEDGARATRVVGLLRPGGSRARLRELEESGAWGLVEADLTEREAVGEAVREVRPRAILHLALERAVHEPLPDDRRYALAIAPLETLVTALAEVGGRRFVHTGSAWVLRPGDALDESAPVEPATPYAETKAWEARRLPRVAAEQGVDWINLRLFNVFGRYESSSRLLPYLVRRLSGGEPAELSDGDLVRDFTDVDDMARAYPLALRAPGRYCGRTYHIGSGRRTTIREFAGMAAEVTGHGDRIRFGRRDTPDRYMDRLVSDPGLARRRLGWSVQASLETRVRRAAEWWLDRDGGKT